MARWKRVTCLPKSVASLASLHGPSSVRELLQAEYDQLSMSDRLESEPTGFASMRVVSDMAEQIDCPEAPARVYDAPCW